MKWSLYWVNFVKNEIIKNTRNNTAYSDVNPETTFFTFFNNFS